MHVLNNWLAIQNAVRVADVGSLNALYIPKAHLAAHKHVAGFYIQLSICCPILVRAVSQVLAVAQFRLKWEEGDYGQVDSYSCRSVNSRNRNRDHGDLDWRYIYIYIYIVVHSAPCALPRVFLRGRTGHSWFVELGDRLGIEGRFRDSPKKAART